ncbi:alpha/beta hydrolase family protein [Parapedobacter sp. 10938]|uniref:alpha/beta hydrolase family protein n=1 Tax=Parapedobacter flavus TaxID=3110225 RepID=UPI002DB8022F|nr:acetylxylan esterase [Parapedobacter sp. 10938]MEC3880099.1 acetylxylan esterase [Parapedobacter sp. 10938]
MKIQYKPIGITMMLLTMASASSWAQRKDVNYDESKVGAYTLPALLTNKDGQQITTVAQWEQQRRPELLNLFSTYMYGRTPTDPVAVRYEVLTENPQALGGKATSRQVKLLFSNGTKTLEALLLVYLPNNGAKQVPMFVGYNFKGNHSTTLDTTILYSKNFALVKEAGHPDWERGCQASRWSYDDIIDRGYGVATMCYHDIFPDKPGLKDHSIVSLFPGYDADSEAPDEWQAIGAWAWGSSRIVDYLATEPRVDTARIAIMGHSRQGKAALWAGAQDTRFKVVISNNSGEGGAALSRRNFGETLAIVSSIKPAWFCPAYDAYHRRADELPFDQHELIALMAPRAVYVASAEEDRWADPKGEYLAAYHAGPVYELYGLQGLPSATPPAIHQPIMQDVGYHIRAGKHDVTRYDWLAFLDFADKHFKMD